MPESGRLFLGARRRHARRVLRKRIGWVVGFLAGALLVSLICLAWLIKEMQTPAPVAAALRLPVTVEVTEEGFWPEVVIVQPGSEVRWVVQGGTHRILARDEAWGSERMSSGVFFISMPEKGQGIEFLDYECTEHGRGGSIHLLPTPAGRL